MTTNEKLDRIVAKCREIIALGEKRTKGRWEKSAAAHRIESQIGLIAVMYGPEGSQIDYDDTRHRNCDFIVACAGPAEAMAKSTIAAVETSIRNDWTEGRFVESILASWPDEIL